MAGKAKAIMMILAPKSGPTFGGKGTKMPKEKKMDRTYEKKEARR